ncbi:MAG: POU domain, class 5, transcription factor 1 [Marteilia pararefringens]
MTTKYRIGSNTDSPEPNSAPNDSSLEQPAKLNKLDDFDSKRIFNDAVGSVDCNYYDEVDETYSSQSHNDELTLRIVENPECSDLKGHNEQRIMDVAIDSYRKGCVSSISNSYASSHGSDSNISQPNESNDGENDISSKTHNEDDCTRHGSSENIGTEPKVNLINFSKIFSLSSVDENEKNQDSLNTSSITCESLDDKFRNNKPRIYLSNRNMQQKTKSQSRMKRRKRTKISDSQHSDLENLFALVNRPDSFQVNSIAMQCGLTPRVVQVWFQNRRAKHKRIESKRSELSAENKLSDFSNNSIITIGSPGETNDNTTMMDNHPSVRDLKTFEKFMTGEVKADQ